MRALAADLTYVEDRFQSDVAVVFDEQDGRIDRVQPAARPTPGIEVERCSGCALVPGLVNAHSHAFQRAIRGRTQWRPLGEHADFWSWREAMYRAVLRLSPDDMYELARFCFIEMLLAGYTTVGEFHYVQRDERGAEYANPNELALQLIRAAQEVGIRIALLNVCYATGGVGEALREEQRRFGTPDLDRYLSHTEQLRSQVQGKPLVSVGLAPHSLRAVPSDWLAPIASHAREHDLPLHMHVAEQPAEVDACMRAYGRRPGELLADRGLLDARFTAVHATHLNTGEILALGQAGITVCACPTTERDLGDGIPSARELVDAGARLCIGSDSQTVIDPWEEMRSIEYHTRLATLRRVILAEEVGHGRSEVGPLLFRAGGANGAGSLKVDAGVIAPGKQADFVLIDLDHPSLAGWTQATLAAHLALCAPAAVVRDVWVAGRIRVQEGQHPALKAARPAFDAVCQRVLP
jgi:formimidoylglutamate deiminase